MSISMWIKCFVIAGVLVVCSYFDMKEKKVPVVSILLGTAAVIVLNIVGGEMSFVSCLIGGTLGAILLLISRLTKNAFGVGDALLVLMIGLGSGIYQTTLVLFYGLLVTAFVSAVLLFLKRVKRKTELPFVPFLLIGYVGVMISWQL